MKMMESEAYLILSKCRMMVLKGAGTNKMLCLVNETEYKRPFSFPSKKKAEAAIKSANYWLSEKTRQYILDNYEDIRREVQKNPHYLTSHTLRDINFLEPVLFLEKYEEIKEK